MRARHALLALLFTAGCSDVLGADFEHAAATDAADAGDSGNEGNATVVSGAKTDADASSPSTVPTTTTGPGTTSGPSMSGRITLQHAADGTWTADAQFVEAPADTADVDCSLVHEEGNCIVQKCINPQPPGIAPSYFSSYYLSAGAVTVGGLFGTIDLAPEDGRYLAEDGPDGGEGVNASGKGTLYANGVGAAFPAFSVSASAPASLAMTSPANGSTVALSGGEPLDIAWNGTGAGTFILQIEGPNDGQTYETACRFAATDGHGTVPASVLYYLRAPGEQVTLQGVVTTEGSVTVGASTVTFDVYERMLDQNGDVYNLTTNAPN